MVVRPDRWNSLWGPYRGAAEGARNRITGRSDRERRLRGGSGGNPSSLSKSRPMAVDKNGRDGTCGTWSHPVGGQGFGRRLTGADVRHDTRQDTRFRPAAPACWRRSGKHVSMSDSSETAAAVPESDCRQSDADRVFRRLREKLSPRGDVVSEEGRQRTIELFGEPLSPRGCGAAHLR